MAIIFQNACDYIGPFLLLLLTDYYYRKLFIA